MLHNGNLLLSGWYVSDVSFWTFEVPVDGLVAAVYGLRVDVVHVAAAIEYALLVLFAALLAAGAARDRRFGGREGLIRALVAIGVMVAPATYEGAGVLLGAPDHIGVGVPVLITLLVVDRGACRADGRGPPLPWRWPRCCWSGRSWTIRSPRSAARSRWRLSAACRWRLSWSRRRSGGSSA